MLSVSLKVFKLKAKNIFFANKKHLCEDQNKLPENGTSNSMNLLIFLGLREHWWLSYIPQGNQNLLDFVGAQWIWSTIFGFKGNIDDHCIYL